MYYDSSIAAMAGSKVSNISPDNNFNNITDGKIVF